MKNAGKYAFKVIFITVFAIISLSILISCLENLGDAGYINFPADDSNYARITAVEYKAEVVDEPDGQGKIIITELLTFDIHAASERYLFWELWRDLPEEVVDDLKVDYNVLSVRQVFNDGRAPVIFDEAPKLYWDDEDYINTEGGLGPGKWFHSGGPYDGRRNFECLLLYVDGLFRERVFFEITYEMTNAAIRYGDCSELYVTMYAENTINFLESYKGQFLFPSDIMPRAGNYYAHTYGTNSHTFPFIESTTLNPGYYTFAFELDKSQLSFRPYNEYIEFALISFGDDKHIFTQHAPRNPYFYTDVLDQVRRNQARYEALPAVFMTARIVVVVLLSAGAVFALVMSFGIDKRLKKKYKFHQPEMEIQYFREIPSQLDPIFASILVFCKHTSSTEVKDGYSAILLDLVRKGYLELDRVNRAVGWTHNNTRIIVKNRPVIRTSNCIGCGTPTEGHDQFCAKCGLPVATNDTSVNLQPLTPTEELYFNLIIRYTATSDITIQTLQNKVSHDYEYSDTFVKAMKKASTDIGISKPMYFQSPKYKKVKNSLNGQAVFIGVIGAIILIAGNLISYPTRLGLAFGAFFILGGALIVSAIYLKAVSKKYILLTQFGETEYAKWRGLYNFLDSNTLMNERTVLDLVIWEQYLVYATAFGISEKVIKAIQLRCPEESLRSSPVLYNPYFRTRSFYRVGRSFGTAARTASYTHRSGSHGIGGGFGGGGYGGAGRGGGGGGGGH